MNKALRLICFVWFLFSRIVPNLDEDVSPTSKSDTSDGNDVNYTSSIASPTATTVQSPKFIQNVGSKALGSLKCLQSNPEDDEIGDGLRTTQTVSNATAELNDFSQQNIVDRTQQQPPFPIGKPERRRRKLPEIPKNKKCKPKPT